MERTKATKKKDIANALTVRLVYYTRSGHLFYWGSFLVLILIEFLLGGQLSKILTREHYAIYINVLNNLPFYSVLLNAGMAYGLVYMVSYNSGTGLSLFRQALITQTRWYLVLVPVHLLVYYLFGNAWFQALLITLIISYTYSYRLNITSLFLATRTFQKAAVSNLLQKLGLLLIVACIVYSPWLRQLLNSQFLFLYPGIELAMTLLYFIAFARTNFAAFSAPAVNYRKRLVKYGKYAMVNNGLNVLYYMLFAIMLRMAGIGLHMQVILGLCIVFFRYTAVAVGPVFSTMSPELTRVKSNKQAVREMYKRYLAFTLILGVVSLILCKIFFGSIIVHFYSPDYADLPGYFYFFCYLMPLLFLNSFHGSVLAALGKIKYTTWAEVSCTILLLLFSVYNAITPVTDHRLFYYIAFTHLAVKFILLSRGVYRTISAK